MKIKYPYLSDNEFLSIVDQMNIREQVVKLTLLNWDEEPIRDIQGLVTGGSLNIDGSSSMRRTANISLVVADNTAAYDDLDNLFSINKKIYLEIGLFNTTNYYNDYPIIWFPQGLFIIDSMSLSHDVNSSSISLSLKDKMCLLNGQCGGMLPASVTFHEIEEVQNDGSIKIITPTIYQIIQELVNHYGDEDLNRIIIEDIDEEVKQVVKWIGADALHRYDNKNDKNTVIFSETPIDKDNDIIYNYGYNIGYIYTPFTYPGELIGAAGQTVCDILDTIRDTLGNFEYFYDIDGNFVFREIKNYLNITQSTVDLENLNNGNAYLVDPTKGKAAYSFKNSNIITSYSNSPQLNNVKNDFIIWGKREQIDKSTLPIRYHLAIDKKPIIDKNGTIKVKIVRDKETKDITGIFANNINVEIDTEKEEIKVIEIQKNQGDYDWRCELYFSGLLSEKTGIKYNNYYIELMNEWLKLYNITDDGVIERSKRLEKQGETLDYYLDFIDSNSKIGQLSIDKIGKRTKVLVDDKINCIFEPEIPNVVILEAGASNITELEKKYQSRGEVFTQVSSELYSKMVLGGTFNSALTAMRDLLYQYTNYNESISLNAIPIYHLEPNIRIEVQDSRSNIFGEYLINSISIPFDAGSQMSISATRILTKF